MTVAKLYDLARMTTATTGTGTLTLGAAVSGFLSFAGAGVVNGDVVFYAIADGANSEIGTGTYTSSGTTLTRSVLKSTNSNAAINLSGSAQVFITSAAEGLTDAANLLGSSTSYNPTFPVGGNWTAPAAYTFTVYWKKLGAKFYYVDINLVITDKTGASGSVYFAFPDSATPRVFVSISMWDNNGGGPYFGVVNPTSSIIFFNPPGAGWQNTTYVANAVVEVT